MTQDETMVSDPQDAITRPLFESLSTNEVLVWYIFVVVSIVILIIGVLQLICKYRQGAGHTKADQLLRGAWRSAKIILSHSWIRRRATATGIAHIAMFYGFLLLFVGTVIITIDHDIAKPLLNWSFWRGRFYLVFSFAMDMAGIALLAGILAMAIRRAFVKPARLRYDRVDGVKEKGARRYFRLGDWAFLGILFFLTLTGFLLEGLRIAIETPEFERWSPVGWSIARFFHSVGIDSDQSASYHYYMWWIHGVSSIFFVSSIPYTKAVHMLTAPAAIATRNQNAGTRLPDEDLDGDDPKLGYSYLHDFSATHLLQLDACTRCGKCHEACPAAATGYPLSPRDVILDLHQLAAKSARASLKQHIPGEIIKQDTIWSCMQCMACTEICPVGIEHVPIITQLRRSLVEEGAMDTMLQNTLEQISSTGNSFGESKRKRARWAKQLAIPIKDIRKESARYLWFVGDYASFDPRNQQITQQLARVFQLANIDVGILYEAEKTAGNDVRRAGEEGLWASLAEDNIETMSKCDFDFIICRDPHSYNTLKNEYPAAGAPWRPDQVFHYTEVLDDLISKNKIAPKRQLDYRATYHDPCTLGRFNGVYDAPRNVLKSTGTSLLEMPRCRDNSFCCGAGGGRIWMKEAADPCAQRPSENRIDEAVRLGKIDYFVVACPKDVTMYEDAIKTSGNQENIQVKELTELVLEAYL